MKTPFENSERLFMFLCVVSIKLAMTTGISSPSGEPLFLTPYIENGDIETGRILSRVGQLPNAPSVTSYSGFFTINKEYNSNTFFWFFPAMNNNVSAPFILWLQGGPGTSSLLGMFVENGPYVLYSNTTAGLRNHAWTKEFNILYVDNPIGAGFSFTENEKGYATGQDQIASDLYIFLEQFFEVYHEYSQNDFYICGESYAGQYVPYLGHKLATDGPPARLNFKGICVGNGHFDVRLLHRYEDFLCQLGVVDYKQAASIKNIYDDMIYYLDNGENFLAAKEFNKYFVILTDPDIVTTSFMTTFSGYEFFYNFLFIEKPKEYSYYTNYVQNEMTRRAIHVGNLPFRNFVTVKHYLKVDPVVSSSIEKIASLANNYKVLIYNGQFDLACPYVVAESLLNNLIWKHSEDYKNADRKIWRINGKNDVAGYVRNYGNLFGVLVRNAGHLVPHDQPVAALDLITRFVKDIPYA